MRSHVPRIQILLLVMVILLMILFFVLPVAAPRPGGTVGSRLRSGSGSPSFPVMNRMSDVATRR